MKKTIVKENLYKVGDFVIIIKDDESNIFDTSIGKIISINNLPTKYKYEVQFIQSIKTPIFIHESRSYSEKEIQLYPYNADLLEKIIDND